jgi:hypothetical protein
VIRWLLALCVLSGLDGLLTVRAVEQGATELNPMLAWALPGRPAAFWLVKAALTLLGAALLWWARYARLAQWAVRAAVVAYAALVVYEVAGLI